MERIVLLDTKCSCRSIALICYSLQHVFKESYFRKEDVQIDNCSVSLNYMKLRIQFRDVVAERENNAYVMCR